MSIQQVTSVRASFASTVLPSFLNHLQKSVTTQKQHGGLDGLTNNISSVSTMPGRTGLDPNTASNLYALLARGIETGKSLPADGANGLPSKVQTDRRNMIKLAAAQIAVGQVQRGRETAQRVLDQHKNDVDALRVVGSSYLEERNYKQAERVYARAAGLSPNNPILNDELRVVKTLQESDEHVLSVARRKMKDPGQRESGFRLLGYLSRRSPANAEVYLIAAESYSMERKSVQELGALQEALRHSDDAQADRVVAQASRLADDHPDAAAPRNLLGRALLKSGQVERGIRELQRAADIAPDNHAFAGDLADAYAQRAQRKFDRGDVLGAQVDVQAAANIDLFNAGAKHVGARVDGLRAQREILAGQFTTASSKLNKAAREAGDDEAFKKKLAQSYILAAVHFENNNGDSVALTNYISAYALDPGSTVAGKKVSELSHGRGIAALDSNNYDSAITHLERAYTTLRSDTAYATDLAKAHDARGQYRVAIGKLDDAIEDYKKGISVDPANTSLAVNYSAAIARKGG